VTFQLCRARDISTLLQQLSSSHNETKNLNFGVFPPPG
jgi:hypothetical protein